MIGVLTKALAIFSRAALPPRLLSVGAALVLNSIKASIKPIVVSRITKLLILPRDCNEPMHFIPNRAGGEKCITVIHASKIPP